MSDIRVQLSCKQCTRRKTKCDKAVPCSACITSGLDCQVVQRQRLPRGRSGNQTSGKPASLKHRLAHLEHAITHLQARRAPAVTSDPIASAANRSGHDNEPKPEAVLSDGLVAADFWRTLGEAVEDIRLVLNDNSFDDVNETTSASTNSMDLTATGSNGSNVLLFGTNKILATPYCEDSWLEQQLLETYHDRFDPLVKVLHWPTALRLMTIKQSSNIASKSMPAQGALRSAVLFAAICTLHSHEMEDKAELTRRYRSEAEESFINVGLLTTTSVVVLQAFVIYLAALRTCQSNAQQWSLVALAFRIASSMGISGAAQKDDHDLNTELRKRLWCCLGLLDMQSSFDRGSRPLLRADDLSVRPTNINDADLVREDASRAYSADPERQLGFTEMTFSLITYRAGIAQRRLAEGHTLAPVLASGLEKSRQIWWERQVAIVADFEGHVVALSQICNSQIPLHQFALAVAQGSLLAMRLQLHRPLSRSPHGFRPISSGFDVLGAGVVVLESAAFKTSPDFVKWSWFSWVKWYALAIVLAELCRSPWDDRSIRAWSQAQLSYDAYKKLVADAETGLLWKPIARLMRKVAGIAQVELLRGANENDSVQPQHVAWTENHQALPPAGRDVSAASLDGTSNYGNGFNIDLPASEQILADDTDPMSWVHWDMFVDDKDQSTMLDTTFWG